MPRFLLLAALGLLAAAPRAQDHKNRVANYYAGTPKTSSYEHFSFWTIDGHRDAMQYSYGPTRQNVTLSYAGTTRLQGRPAFKVRFPDGKLRYIAPSGNTLLVAAAPTAQPQEFRWEYEGPVNGIGTNCRVCTPNAAAAVQLVRQHFVE